MLMTTSKKKKISLLLKNVCLFLLRLLPEWKKTFLQKKKKREWDL